MEIPALQMFRTVGTQEGKRSRERKNRPKRKGGESGKTGSQTLKREWERKISSEVAEPTLSRKAAIVIFVPVPQTDTGRRGENPKADGRSIVKELGKMTP